MSHSEVGVVIERWVLVIKGVGMVIERGCGVMDRYQLPYILSFLLCKHGCVHTEHRDKLHGTLATFDAVDRRLKGE